MDMQRIHARAAEVANWRRRLVGYGFVYINTNHGSCNHVSYGRVGKGYALESRDHGFESHRWFFEKEKPLDDRWPLHEILVTFASAIHR